LIQKFPLSYHSIIKIPDEASLPELVSKLGANPAVRFRTDLSPEFNDDVLVLEYLLKTGKIEKAQRFISMMRTSQVSTLEPEFQLYFATLTYRAHRGLETFRIVSRFINENKVDVSPALLKMLYPLWYSDEIAKGALTSGVDPVLLTALIRQESAFDAKANSTADARGLMQMLPSTSRHFGVPKIQLFTPTRNVFVGSRFLATLLKRYDGKLHLALAAYNAGTIPVDQWVVRYPTDDPHLFMDLIPYKETREYVASILRNLSWYKALYPSMKTSSSQLSARNSEM
jgi:soluble lytic murein transglycosylase